MVYRGLVIAVILSLGSSASHARMSVDTLVSAGSFFAAADRCEDRDQISRGQTAHLIAALRPYFSKSDTKLFKRGMSEGWRRSSVYLAEQRRWEPFAADEASCSRVQAVLDDYKTTLLSQ